MRLLKPSMKIASSLLAATVLVPLPAMSSDGLGPVQGGQALGSFAIPQFNSGVGYIDGSLYFGDIFVLQYDFDATLLEVATPCLSCIEGRILGTLDDGVGEGPDFIVRGRYFGSFHSGTGTLSARILMPGGGPAVGRISGSFTDRPDDATPGFFSGAWGIRP